MCGGWGDNVTEHLWKTLSLVVFCSFQSHSQCHTTRLCSSHDHCPSKPWKQICAMQLWVRMIWIWSLPSATSSFLNSDIIWKSGPRGGKHVELFPVFLSLEGTMHKSPSRRKRRRKRKGRRRRGRRQRIKRRRSRRRKRRKRKKRKIMLFWWQLHKLALFWQISQLKSSHSYLRRK